MYKVLIFTAKIAKLETEDQQAVVTELRTHEQGLVGLKSTSGRSVRDNAIPALPYRRRLPECHRLHAHLDVRIEIFA
jgi:hypothetical protein